MTELKGKVALVTGAGRGLGEAICRVLAESGVTVVLADVREELAHKLQVQLGSGMALYMDVTQEAQVGECISRIVNKYAHLDILVNNAGVDVTHSVEELSFEDWNRILAVNLTGAFNTSKQVFHHMKRQGGGQIVNIVSTAAKRTWANAAAYHASKWGLLGFSHALHVEGRPVNIKVTAVVSGGMRTPFLFERFPDLDPALLQDPRNVAETVRFVLSQPAETVIPEIMVLPMRETSWP
jgi:NADP-dependent 3-hydroxy acid dehydrogenase YdfG